MIHTRKNAEVKACDLVIEFNHDGSAYFLDGLDTNGIQLSHTELDELQEDYPEVLYEKAQWANQGE